MIMISNFFFFNFISFCIIASFLTKLLTLHILFPTAIRAVLAAKLVMLGISPFISFILALRVVLAAKLVIRTLRS